MSLTSNALLPLVILCTCPEHKPVEVDPTAAEAFIMSGFVHRLSVMGCVQRVPPSPEAIQHEQKATAAFRAAQQLGVENLQESIGMMESEIQRGQLCDVLNSSYTAYILAVACSTQSAINYRRFCQESANAASDG